MRPVTKVYIAASSKELERARRLADRARKLGGVEVVSDWIDIMSSRAAEGLSDADMTREQRAKAALSDLGGIASADAVVGLLSHHESEMRFEIGFAHGMGKVVVLSRESGRLRLFDSVFMSTPDDISALGLAVTTARLLGSAR